MQENAALDLIFSWIFTEWLCMIFNPEIPLMTNQTKLIQEEL